MGQGGPRLDPSGLGEVDPLVGEVDLELAVAREHQRDADRERAPLAGLALQVDVAAEQLGQLADDRQAQPGPLMLAGQDVVALAGGLRLAELLEDRLPILLGDADPGILDLDDHEPALGAGPEGDAAPLGRELDGVGEQVVEDLPQLARVLAHQRDRLVDPVLQVMFFRSAIGRQRFVRPSQTSRIEKSSVRTSILPLSILARSRMSLIIDSSILPDVWMLPAYRRCRSLSGSLPGEDLGEADDRVERRPQLVAHRRQEVALEPVHLEERHVGLRQLVDLAVEVVVDLAELLLHGDQVVEHPVEGVRELLELVAGLDLAADVQPAGGDRVGDVAEVLDRLDDHVPDDHQRRDHRQDRRDHRGGDQHGPIAVDRLVRLLHRQVDDHGAGQVARLGLDPVLAVGRGPLDVVVDVIEVPSSLPWQSIKQVGLKKTAWMYWNSFLPLVIRSAQVGDPSAKVWDLSGEWPALRVAADWTKRASVAARTRRAGCFLASVGLYGSSTQASWLGRSSSGLKSLTRTFRTGSNGQFPSDL